MQSFKKLSKEESADLLRRIHEDRCVVFFKFPSSPVYKTKAGGRNWGHSILCARPANLVDDHKGKEGTINVVAGGQIYFIRARAKYDRRKLHLELQTEIHQLVRRKNRRLRIPEGREASFITKSVVGKTLFLKGVVQDISLQGCRLALNVSQPALKSGDVLIGHLKVGRRRTQLVTGTVRHHRKMQTGRYDQIFGLQFTSFDGDSEMKVGEMLVDLQRDNFTEM